MLSDRGREASILDEVRISEQSTYSTVTVFEGMDAHEILSHIGSEIPRIELTVFLLVLNVKRQ